MMKGKGLQLLFKKNKKIIIAASLLATLAIGETFAWIAPQVSVTNELKAHEVNVGIKENFPENEASGKKTKEVSFQNNGDSDVFIRVTFEEYWESGTGDDRCLLSNSVNGVDVAKKVFNASDPSKPDPALWQYGEGQNVDGWYYYTKVLHPGETTSVILKSVTFKEYTGEFEKYKDANYNLYFKVEAVQASTNSKYPDEAKLLNKNATEQVFRTELIQPSGGKIVILPSAEIGNDGETVIWTFNKGE